MNIIITGPKQCGKSTIVRKILSSLIGSVSGFLTEFSDRGSSERKLLIKSIDGTKSRCAAKWSDGQVSVDMSAFDNFAPALIATSTDYVVIDELGKFEKNSENLKLTVNSAFDSDVDVIAAIRLDADGWMQALKARDDVFLFTINGINRDSVPGRVLELLTPQSTTWNIR